MATGYWKGATNTPWTTLANWAQAITGTPNVTVAPGAGDTAFFNANGFTSAYNIFLSGSRSVGGINLNGNSNDVVLFGGTFATPATQTLTLGSIGLVTTGATGNLFFYIQARIALTTANTPLTIGAGRSVNIDSIVSGTGFGWNITGSSTSVLKILNSNTYTGTTSIASVWVQIAANSSLGTGAVTMTGGKLSSFSTTGYTLANALTLNGTMTLGDATNTGALTFSGTTTISGATALTTASDVFLTGVVSGANAWSKAGSAILRLTNANTFSQGLSISAGTVEISNASALGTGTVTMTGGKLSSSSTTAYTLANALSLSGTMTLGDATNKGALTFSFLATSSANATIASNVLFSAGLTLNGGTMSANTGDYNAFSTFGTTAGLFTINSGATLTANNTVNNAHNIGALTLAGGTLTSVNGAGGLANDNGYGNWILNGALTVTANSLISSSSFVSRSNVININSGTTLTISSVFSDSGPDVTNVVKSTGTGTLTLTGANTFTGTVSVSAGTLNANSATALGSNGSSVSVTSGATLSLGAAPTYTSRSLTIGGTGTASTVGALVIANAGTNQFQSITLGSPTNYIRATSSGVINAPFTSNNNSIIFGASAGSDFIPFASLSNVFSGLGSVTYGGHSLDAGIVRADVRHTYTGNTTLAYGTTYVDSSLELPTTSGPLGNKSLTAANTLLMTGGTLSYLGGSVDYSGRFSTAGSQQWKIDAAGQTITYATALVGASSLSLNDTSTNGSLTLSSASSTFSGGVTLTSGTLFAGAAQSGVSGPLGITGTITFSPAGTGVLAYTSASASFDYSSRFATSNGQNRRINVNGESVTFSTAIGGDNALLLVGSAGFLTLAVANTYTQGTTISVGTLKAGNATALGTGAVTISASGATLQTLTAGGQNGKLTVAALTNSAGGTIKIGG
jgi:autotransporter-associated beta strand protein